MRGLGVALVVLGLAGGCVQPRATNATGTPHVIAAFYPIYEAAQRIGGEAVDVVDLTGAGAEPHDLELTPHQVDQLAGADVVLYLGHGFQPAVEDALGQSSGVKVDLLDVLALHKARANGMTVDPHVWLDPVRWRSASEQIAKVLEHAVPAHRAGVASRARSYVAKLGALDTSYSTGLATCRQRALVTNHAAFGYLSSRYHLEQFAISGLAPESEPSPQRIAELTDMVKRKHISNIFTETLVSPKVADTLAREAGVKTRVLNPIESMTDAQLVAGASYVTEMMRNLTTLRSALQCR